VPCSGGIDAGGIGAGVWADGADGADVALEGLGAYASAGGSGAAAGCACALDDGSVPAIAPETTRVKKQPAATLL